MANQYAQEDYLLTEGILSKYLKLMIRFLSRSSIQKALFTSIGLVQEQDLMDCVPKLLFFELDIPTFFSPSLYVSYCKPLLNSLSSMLLYSESSSPNLRHHNPRLLLSNTTSLSHFVFVHLDFLNYVYKCNSESM